MERSRQGNDERREKTLSSLPRDSGCLSRPVDASASSSEAGNRPNSLHWYLSKPEFASVADRAPH
jgi:hypothetical protein